MPIRNIDKKKSNNEETKTEWQTTFCGLVHSPSLQKKQRKNIKGNKNEMTNKLLCCAQPPSLQKKEKQTKQTKKGTKSILANFLLWLCLAFISAKKKTNKKRKPKNIEGNKEQNGNYLPWPCPASISAWQQLAPVSDQGSMPIVPVGKLKKNYTKASLFQRRSRQYGRTFFSGHVQG